MHQRDKRAMLKLKYWAGEITLNEIFEIAANEIYKDGNEAKLPSRTAYIVQRQDCDDLFIEGAFSTKEKAEKFCLSEHKELYTNGDQNFNINITPIVIDEREV